MNARQTSPEGLPTHAGTRGKRSAGHPPRASMAKLLLLPTGTANTASVMAALRRAGGEPCVASTPRQIRLARALVVPGVGTYQAALAHLRSSGLLKPLARRLQDGQPTLLICLGMQLLCTGSQESPGNAGLGLLPAQVRRFPSRVRHPHMGWNCVRPGPGCRFLRDGYAYFAHSYRLLEPPDGWHTALTDHDGPFVAACEKGAVLACQFHPELSGVWGADLLQRWLSAALKEPTTMAAHPAPTC